MILHEHSEMMEEEAVAKPDSEVSELQERIDKALPRVVGDAPDRPMKVLVRRGEKTGTALVLLWFEDRGSVPSDYEPGRQLVLTEPIEALTKLTNREFADWLAKAVTRLLRPEE